ncbi:metal-dependent hydrolase [Desulfotomaculum defluvii]
MDTATHLLTSLGVAALGQNIPTLKEKDTQKAIFWAAVAGSQIPDLDIIYRLKSELAYLEVHRGFSHSFPALFIIPLLIMVILRLFFPRLSKPLILVVAFTSTLLHIFLDLLTSYGTQFLWPLSDKRLGWDILMIIDPFILLVCALAIVTGKRSSLSPVKIFTTMFVVIGLYILLRTGIHQKGLLMVNGKYDMEKYRSISVLPGFGLNQWGYILDPYDKSKPIIVGHLNILERKVTEEHQYLNDTGPVVDAGAKTPVGRVFIKFARHPLATVKETGTGYLVSWSDLRYRYQNHHPFTAYVRFDKNLKLLGSGLGRKYTYED